MGELRRQGLAGDAHQAPRRGLGGLLGNDEGGGFGAHRGAVLPLCGADVHTYINVATA
jgi:hypothetical protein